MKAFILAFIFLTGFLSCSINEENGSDKDGCTSNFDCPLGTECNLTTGECEKDTGTGDLPDSDTDTGNGKTKDCSGHGVLNSSNECECNDGYSGSNCDRCADGYTGYPDCRKEGGVCAGIDCNGHGKCLESIGKCSCYTGYGGEFCDECMEGYGGYPDCVYKLCEPGTTGCRGNVVVVCSADGTEFVDSETCEGEGISCYKGKCLDECGIAAEDKSYVGCEYWGAFLQQPGGIASNATYALVVANPNETDVNVKVFTSGDTLLAEQTITARELYSFELGGDKIISGSGISDLGFKLVAERPVTVTQMNPFGNVLMYSNDATILLPIGALAGEYFVMSWPTWGIRRCSGALGICSSGDTSSSPGYISIVAAEEGTTEVTVKYSAATKSGTGVNAEVAGAKVKYTLNQYQILTVNSADAYCPNPSCSGISCDGFSGCYGPDLTGTYIFSDKKVAVFGGSECTFIPEGDFACDHMEHQIFPLQTWGKNFVAVRTKPRGSEVDYFRFLASEDGTEINWIGGISGTVTLNAGQMHELFTTSNFKISASKPILVGQFLASEDAGAGTGDPAMMLLAPDEQLRTDYIFLVPPNYDNDRVTIVAQKDTDIVMNETTYSSNSFVQIPGTDWYGQWVDVTFGVYTLTASKPVGLYVYGFSTYVSYAYTAGLDLNAINIQQ